MPDQVENTGSDAQTQPEATPAANGADQPRKGPRNGFESRIAELVKEKHEVNRTWQSKYDDLLASNDATQRELAEIKAMLGNKGTSQGSKSPIFSGFDQMSAEDMDTILAQGPGDNPAFYASVLKESQKRYGEELLSRATKQQTEAQKAQMRQMTEWNKIRQKYPEIDQDGPMRARANEYMTQLQREYGQDVRNDMNAQWRCAQAAYHDLHAQDAEELQTQRREVERLKQTQAMGTGVKSAMRLNDKVEEQLKRARLSTNSTEQKQAIGSALRNLEIVQDIRQDR